jgi:seryl-tRNA synthetase
MCKETKAVTAERDALKAEVEKFKVIIEKGWKQQEKDYEQCMKDRDRLAADLREAHADCIRLQQEINCLRMEPYQLPKCVALATEMSRLKSEALNDAKNLATVCEERDHWRTVAKDNAKMIAFLGEKLDAETKRMEGWRTLAEKMKKRLILDWGIERYEEWDSELAAWPKS